VFDDSPNGGTETKECNSNVTSPDDATYYPKAGK